MNSTGKAPSTLVIQVSLSVRRGIIQIHLHLRVNCSYYNWTKQFKIPIYGSWIGINPFLSLNSPSHDTRVEMWEQCWRKLNALKKLTLGDSFMYTWELIPVCTAYEGRFVQAKKQTRTQFHYFLNIVTFLYVYVSIGRKNWTTGSGIRFQQLTIRPLHTFLFVCFESYSSSAAEL